MDRKSKRPEIKKVEQRVTVDHDGLTISTTKVITVDFGKPPPDPDDNQG